MKNPFCKGASFMVFYVKFYVSECVSHRFSSLSLLLKLVTLYTHSSSHMISDKIEVKIFPNINMPPCSLYLF